MILSIGKYSKYSSEEWGVLICIMDIIYNDRNFKIYDTYLKHLSTNIFIDEQCFQTFLNAMIKLMGGNELMYDKYETLCIYKEVMLEAPYEELPIHMGWNDVMDAIIAWRFKIGR